MCILCVRHLFFYHSGEICASHSSRNKGSVHYRLLFLSVLSNNTQVISEPQPAVNLFTDLVLSAINAQIAQSRYPMNVVYKKFRCRFEKHLINTAYFMHNPFAQRIFLIPLCPVYRARKGNIIGIFHISRLPPYAC